MSSNALVPSTPAALQTIDGAQVNFKSRFLDLKPATLSINQPNTQVDGAIKGRLRISETSQQFEEMYVTLLDEPDESRAYYIGEKGTLNRTPDNLMCFSRDLFKPDAKSKVPQAMKCNGCPRSDWTPWREKKDKTGIKDPLLIPTCDPTLRVVLIDTVFKIPLQMFLHSQSKREFEDELQSVARLFSMLKSQGKQPNWYDVSFRLGTRAVKNGNGTTSYVPTITDAKAITDTDRETFGDIYLQFVNRGKRTPEEVEEQQVAAKIENASNVIEGELVEPGTAPSVEVNAQEITI